MKRISRYKHRHKSLITTIKSTVDRHRWLVLLPLLVFTVIGIGVSSITTQPVSAQTADQLERICSSTPSDSRCQGPKPIHPTVSAPKKAAFYAFDKCVSGYSGMSMVDYDGNPFVKQGRIDEGSMAGNRWWLNDDDWARGIAAGVASSSTVIFSPLSGFSTGTQFLNSIGSVGTINNFFTPATAGSYLLTDTPSDYGHTKCNDVLKAGLGLWRFDNAMAILDAANVKRLDGSNSDGSGTGGWGEIHTQASAIKSAVSPRASSDGNIKYTSEERYVIYRAAWLRGCTSDGTATRLPSGTDAKFSYEGLKIVDDATASGPARDYVGLDRGKGRWVYINDNGSLVSMDCASIANKVNEYAQTYIDWVQVNKDSERLDKICEETPSAEGCDETLTGNEPTCGSSVPGLGWIICPVINALGGFNDAMWGLTSSLLVVSPLKEGDVAYTIWQSFRNLANVVMALFFIIIIFSQLLNVGVTNYGIKKALPRLVVVAILINLSFIIIQLAVDVSNIVGSNIYGFLSTLAGTASSGASWMALINQLATVTVAAAGTVLGIVLAGGPAAAFYLVLPAAALAALGFVAALATLIFRQAIIPILAILAPLAFVAYLLPNTESWFKKWRDLFISMLILYVTAALLFGGVKLASNMVIGDGDDLWNMMVGLVMLGIPLFALPFIARQGGPLMSGAMKGMQSGIQKLRKPLEGYANPRAKDAQNKFANSGVNSRNPLRRMYANRRMKRLGIESDAASGEEEFKSAYNNTTAGRAKMDRLGKAKIQSAIDSDLSGERIEGDVDLTLKARTAKLELDAAKQRTTQLVQELGTEVSAPHLNAVNAATRSRIQAAQQSMDISKDATAAAEREQRSEYAEALRSSAGVAGGIAQQAGGVGRNGESIAVARAIEQEKRTSNENVAAEGVLMTTQQYSNDEYLSVLSGTLRGGAPASPEQQEAAVTAIHNSGSVGAKIQAGAQLAAMAAANPGDPGVISLQQSFEKLGGLPQYYSGQRRDELRQGTMTATVPELILETSQSGKISPQIIGKMDVDEMKEFVAAYSDPAILGQMSWEQRNNVAKVIDDARTDDVIGKMFGPREIEQLDKIQGLLR